MCILLLAVVFYTVSFARFVRNLICLFIFLDICSVGIKDSRVLVTFCFLIQEWVIQVCSFWDNSFICAFILCAHSLYILYFNKTFKNIQRPFPFLSIFLKKNIILSLINQKWKWPNVKCILLLRIGKYLLGYKGYTTMMLNLLFQLGKPSRIPFCRC